MSSEIMQIPFVDISKPDLKPGSPEWNSIKDLVMEALIEYGCFETTIGEGMEEHGREVIDALPEVFNLSLETKAGNFFSKYIAKQPALPLYESFGIDEPSRKVESFSNLIWPQGNPDFCKAMQSFVENLSKLDQMIHRIISESLGVGQYIDELLENSMYHIRFNKYEQPQNNKNEIGLASHTDINSFTILYQNQTRGKLEVKTKDGRWIHVKPKADRFIVIVGDSIRPWTNGRVHAPIHRVMLMSGNETRYSIAFTTSSKSGYLVKAPEELIDEEHPLLFKPFEFEGLLAYVMSGNAPKTSESALKSYCGI